VSAVVWLVVQWVVAGRAAVTLGERAAHGPALW